MNASPNNDAQYSPSVDSIDEFKLTTTDYSAEYGHALAGVTSFTLKSGTNQFHGSAFEFFRNEKLDARGFFPQVKAPTRQNEFGGTIGGPIRKNNTFFFASVESFRRRQCTRGLREIRAHGRSRDRRSVISEGRLSGIVCTCLVSCDECA